MNARAAAHLPYGRPCIEEDDIEAVNAVLRSGWLTTGPEVEAFENALCSATAARNAVVCNSGTAALHLAAMALGIGAHSTVIVPALTFAATANAPRYLGARIVFADVDPGTGLLTVDTFAAALARAGGADAVFPVHLNGQTVDMPALRAAAAAHGTAVVEDACHALGSVYGADPHTYRVGQGAHSDFQCFSFHPVKTIAMGEGGAVTTRDDAAARRLRNLRSHGIERAAGHFAQDALAYDADGRANPWYYELQELGFNYRASDVQCALGTSQMKKLARFTAERAKLVAAYDRALAPLAPRVRPVARAPACNPAWHLYVAEIDFAALGMERATAMRRLAARGIGTQVHYLPVPFHPYYRAMENGDPARTYPGAARYYARCLSLPLFVGMDEADVARVAETLAAILGA